METHQSKEEQIEQTQEEMQTTTEQADRVGAVALQKTKEAGQWIKDHPVATAASAVGAGVAAGSAIYTRRRQKTRSERMQEAALKYANRAAVSARDAGNRAMSAVKQRTGRESSNGMLSKILYTAGGLYLVRKLGSWMRK